MNTMIKRGVIGSVLMLIIYLVIDFIIGKLGEYLSNGANLYYFSFSIILYVQMLILGFILGVATGYFKYKTNKDFIKSTKSKIILFYIFLVPTTIFPSFLIPMARCCDCFGPACTTISGFPFPVTIWGEIMNVYPKIMLIILSIGIIGFFFNILLCYSISASMIYVIKLLWSKFFPNKK